MKLISHHDPAVITQYNEISMARCTSANGLDAFRIGHGSRTYRTVQVLFLNTKQYTPYVKGEGGSDNVDKVFLRSF